MATFNKDGYPTIPGPLTHTPPLFHKLKILTIYEIFKLQLGLLVFESINNIGPSNNLIKFTRVSEIYNHETRYAYHGNFYINSVRTIRYGLKGLKIEGAKLWATIPNDIKKSQTKKAFKSCFKKHMIKSYVN